LSCIPSVIDNLSSLYELSWNNITKFFMISRRPETWTFLELFYPINNHTEFINLITNITLELQLDLQMHIEFVKDKTGSLMAIALPMIHYTTTSRLTEIIDYFSKIKDITLINPHICALEGTGDKELDMVREKLKKEHDPAGLMNPGKFKIIIK